MLCSVRLGNGWGVFGVFDGHGGGLSMCTSIVRHLTGELVFEVRVRSSLREGSASSSCVQLPKDECAFSRWQNVS